MRELCSRVVEAVGDFWGYIGWILFISFILMPFYVAGSPDALSGLIIIGMLLLAWWLIDLVYQLVPWWMVLAGIAMLVIGTLPRGGILSVACWVIYWMKVRE